MLDFIQVESSSIDAVRYNMFTKELIVLFKQGNLYKYQQISPDEYEQLLTADSIGSHFHKHIRNSKPYAKFEE